MLFTNNENILKSVCNRFNLYFYNYHDAGQIYSSRITYKYLSSDSFITKIHITFVDSILEAKKKNAKVDIQK